MGHLAAKLIGTLIAVALGLHAALSVSERGWWKGPPSDWSTLGAMGTWIALVVIIWTT